MSTTTLTSPWVGGANEHHNINITVGWREVLMSTTTLTSPWVGGANEHHNINITVGWGEVLMSTTTSPWVGGRC